MNRLLTEKMSELKVICRKFRVRELFVFGSITNGHFTSESDIDFLVSFEDMSP
jgi:predicted nucleotidyltransferase